MQDLQVKKAARAKFHHYCYFNSINSVNSADFANLVDFANCRFVYLQTRLFSRIAIASS